MGIEDAKKQMQDSNPSVVPGKASGERKRIPLSVPQRKLEVPGIPGFYLRWFRGTPQRLAQAERAGFEYVDEREIELNNLSLGGDATKAGNTDLGSRVSVIEGSETDGSGQAIRMYLMKQPLHLKKEDDDITQERNDSVAAALTAQYRDGTIGHGAPGAPAEDASDVSARYVDKKRAKVPGLFQKKLRRAG